MSGNTDNYKMDIHKIYQQFFSSIPAPILMFEEKTLRIIDANNEAISFYGYSRDELLRLSMLDISAEEYETKKTVKETVNGALTHIPIRYHRTKNGAIVPVEILPTSVRIAGKTILCGIIKNISARLKAEENLKDSQRKYATLVSNLPGIVYRCLNDKRRTMEFISDRCHDLIGYPAEVFLRKSNAQSINDMIFEEDRDRVIEGIKKALRQNKSFEIAYRIINSTGDVKYVWEHGTGVYDSKGEPLYVEGFISNISEQKKNEINLHKENKLLRSSIEKAGRFGDIIGESAVMKGVYVNLLNSSLSDASVIIYGESGTGKELAARTIHNLSTRKSNPFVIVNCSAVPYELFESEFFGYKKGAFTGANFDKKGYLDRANGGTLFLDEIGDIPPIMQVKLLRAIDEGGYTPLGDIRTKFPNIRIISATNKNLRDLVQTGDVREDFFYRIHVLSIEMPPLRNRVEDIRLLTNHFFQQYSKDRFCSFPQLLLSAFESYYWPGNVRELKNAVMRFIASNCDHEEKGDYPVVTPDIKTSFMESWGNGMMPLEYECNLKCTMENHEKAHLRAVLDSQGWNHSKAAELLNIHQKTLARKLKKYSIE